LNWWSWSEQFPRRLPFDAFVSCKFERKALRTYDHSSDVDEDVSVYGIAGKVEVLVGLNKERSHKFQIKIINIFGIHQIHYSLIILIMTKIYFK